MEGLGLLGVGLLQNCFEQPGLRLVLLVCMGRKSLGLGSLCGVRGCFVSGFVFYGKIKEKLRKI